MALKPAQVPVRKVIACPPECSLHPDKIGEAAAQALLALREQGMGGNTFPRAAEPILGFVISSGTVSRHLLHYRDADVVAREKMEASLPVGNVPHVEILQTIIQRGFANSKSWKPSIKDTLDAMKEHRAMTGGSAFEDMLSAMADAAANEAAIAPDAPDEASEDVAEPLL